MARHGGEPLQSAWSCSEFHDATVLLIASPRSSSSNSRNHGLIETLIDRTDMR